MSSVACGPALALAPVAPDGARTSRAAGISRIQATTPMIIIAVRQSYAESSQAAKGEIVIGATPMPADTNETARLRLVSNHAVAAATIGAKKAPAASPTRMP